MTRIPVSASATAATALIAGAILVGCAGYSPRYCCVSDKTYASDPLWSPSERAWRCFLAVSLPRCEAPGQSSENTLAEWETWQSMDDLLDLSVAPENTQRRLHASLNKCSADSLPKFVDSGSGDQRDRVFEVLANPAAAAVIRSDALGDIARLRHLFDASAAAGESVVRLSPDALIIKACWKPLNSEDQASHFYTRVINGVEYGLVGLNFMSKKLPTWLWASFIQVDAAKLGDKECLGSLGTARPETIGTRWEYYRLIGTQTSFVDPAGRSTWLGNPLFPNEGCRTSCVTCHAYARVDGAGLGLQVIAGVSGSPREDLFYDGGKLKAMQTDFIWSVPNHTVRNNDR